VHPALKEKYRCPVAGIMKYTLFLKKEIAINRITTAVFSTGNTAEDFLKKKNPPQISHFMKIRSVGDQPLEGWTGTHTDMSKLITAF